MDSSNTNKNLRTQLSLASTMFFAPFIKQLLHKSQIVLTPEDKKFVEGYVRLGFIVIGLLLLTIASALAMYSAPGVMFVRSYKISVGLLITCLVLGTLGPVAGIAILQEDKHVFAYQRITTNKSDILLSFFPIYNTHLRYKLHEFTHPYRRAKESQIRWTVLTAIAMITRSESLTAVILMFIVVRIVALLFGIDFFDTQVKNKLNKLYQQNIEEIRAYPRSLVIFLQKKLRTVHTDDLNHIITTQKATYQKLYPIGSTILIQYGIAVVLL